MKDREQELQHLYSLGWRAPAREVSEIPFGLETAVLAHWRSARSQRAENGSFVRGLRWAAVAACAAALLAGVLQNDELSAFSNRFDPASRVADSAITSGFGYE